jgi:hypothetical protein
MTAAVSHLSSKGDAERVGILGHDGLRHVHSGGTCRHTSEPGHQHPHIKAKHTVLQAYHITK